MKPGFVPRDHIRRGFSASPTALSADGWFYYVTVFAAADTSTLYGYGGGAPNTDSPVGISLPTLDGRQSQKKLWGNLAGILRTDYRKDASSAVKGWLRVLDKFDAVDARKKELDRQLEEQEAKGRDRRVKAIRTQLAKLAKEHERALADEKRIIALVLRHAPNAKTLDDFDAEAADEVRAGPGSNLLDRIRKGDEKGEN